MVVGGRMEDLGPMPVKKTFTVLIGGFLKGGNIPEASEVGMIEPCLLYFYIDALNLCIIRVL